MSLAGRARKHATGKRLVALANLAAALGVFQDGQAKKRPEAASMQAEMMEALKDGQARQRSEAAPVQAEVNS